MKISLTPGQRALFLVRAVACAQDFHTFCTIWASGSVLSSQDHAKWADGFVPLLRFHCKRKPKKCGTGILACAKHPSEIGRRHSCLAGVPAPHNPVLAGKRRPGALMAFLRREKYQTHSRVSPASPASGRL